jgi:hypothetical protein
LDEANPTRLFLWVCPIPLHFVGKGLLNNTSQGTIEEKAFLDANANESIDILVEYSPVHPPEDDTSGEGRLSQPALMRGVVRGSLFLARTQLNYAFCSASVAVKRLSPKKPFNTLSLVLVKLMRLSSLLG